MLTKSLLLLKDFLVYIIFIWNIWIESLFNRHCCRKLFQLKTHLKNSVIERQKVLKTYLSNIESTLSLVTFPKYCLKTEEWKIEGNGSRFRSIIISLYCSLFSVCTSSCKCVLIETKTNRFAFYLKSKQKISMQMFFYGSIVNIQR